MSSKCLDHDGTFSLVCPQKILGYDLSAGGRRFESLCPDNQRVIMLYCADLNPARASAQTPSTLPIQVVNDKGRYANIAKRQRFQVDHSPPCLRNGLQKPDSLLLRRSIWIIEANVLYHLLIGWAS